jgi:hypothetical protein
LLLAASTECKRWIDRNDAAVVPQETDTLGLLAKIILRVFSTVFRTDALCKRDEKVHTDVVERMTHDRNEFVFKTEAMIHMMAL